MELPQLLLRALQFFLTLVITALIGNVIHDAFNGNAATINYAMFVAVFSWLVVIYGIIAAVVESFNIPIILMIADGLAAFFTFAAAIALAAGLNVHSCSNRNYTETNHLTDGSFNTGKRCRELQASDAFFWFLWVTFMASAALSFMNRGSVGSGRGARKGPVMTQV